ncbi:IclR family transcriptional regulator [Alloalcanivorax gelatiniphagus]
MKVAQLLKELSGSEGSGASTTELARAGGVSRSTAHRILNTMQRHGLSDRDAESGRWMLGPEVFLLGMACAPRYDIRAVSESIVRRLAAESGESAFLSVRRGDETVCLLREDGSFPLRSHVLHEGLRLPLGVASAGMAILAFMGDPERADYLERTDLVHQFGETHGRALLEARLEQTRADGYSIHPGLLVEGSWGMAAAVFDAAGAPVAALSLTGVEHRFRADRQKVLGPMLLRAAHAVTDAIAPRAASR